ncbi:3'-5' exonuclease [Anaerobacillus isosaccharinicus]|uniref:3'-5' exoribonuclease n=1 Tax=Anaerobacillus isosaccharinicus TaxID=1532552 RepID=A0A1S2KW46_9BACI|nr:exonuclease domain-containing protein [Anaerobacillus isosaccharinicus]MBA5585272.1 3'-5' exoribonuclease [Anaerobacillus isosaccharinicus]QOY36397.1 3'-5' exoribonuclease [Anaerobacillus isosaccharinicus]
MFWKRKKMTYELDRKPSLDTPLDKLSFTVFDTETTGFAIGAKDRLIEIGAVHVENLTVTDKQFQTYVNPNRLIPDNIIQLTGIENHMVDEAPEALQSIEEFFSFIEECGSDGLVGHYISFDLMVLKKELAREKYSYDSPLCFDTLDMIGYLNPSWDMRDLENYAKTFSTKIFQRHSAIGDALTTAHLFCELLKHIQDRGKYTLADLLQILDTNNRNRALQF